MKKINWIIICSVAILAIFNLGREDKPLQIEPMYAESDELIIADKPVMERLNGYFYLRNFHDNKEDFKAILKFMQDSASVQNSNSTTLEHEHEFWGSLKFGISNRGYFKHGFMGCDGKSIGFFLNSFENSELSLRHILTDSKYTIFPNRCKHSTQS